MRALQRSGEFWVFRILCAVGMFALSCTAATVRESGTEGSPPPLTVCELIERSAELRNQIVRVRGRVSSGFEVFALAPSRCEGARERPPWIWLDTTDDALEPYAEVAPADFQAAFRAKRLKEFADGLTWLRSEPVVFRQDEASTKAWRILEDGTSMTVTVVGRFDYVPQARVQRKGDSFIYSGGFGHLSGFSRRIVISYVEAPRQFPSRRWP